MIIRQENKSDYEIVYNVIKKAFESAEHSDGNEQDLVKKLRSSKSFIPQLSLIAEIDGKIVGHILFTENCIGEYTGLTLAPLSVIPEYQNQGIGSSLIRQGHKISKDLGYRFIVVLGSEKYYPKFGYIPALKLGIKVPLDVPKENFMVIDLYGENLFMNAELKYPHEFGI